MSARQCHECAAVLARDPRAAVDSLAPLWLKDSILSRIAAQSWIQELHSVTAGGGLLLQAAFIYSLSVCGLSSVSLGTKKHRAGAVASKPLFANGDAPAENRWEEPGAAGFL